MLKRLAHDLDCEIITTRTDTNPPRLATEDLWHVLWVSQAERARGHGDLAYDETTHGDDW